MLTAPKILIIRFSSFGDILMCMSVISGMKNKFPNSEIHWIVRNDFASILTIDKRIEKVWAFNRKNGLKGLIAYARLLRKEKYQYIYDAHNNLRSFILKLYLSNILQKLFSCKTSLLVKKKQYFKRFLLFNLRINLFPKPYKGMMEFQKPLAKWGVHRFDYYNYKWSFSDNTHIKVEKLLCKVKNTKKWITIVPSTAWELKRWPVEHWKELIKILPSYHFIILGGTKDTFCADIATITPNRTTNLAGKTTLLESMLIVKKSQLVISADTGLIHAADLLHTKGIVLRGPTAFGAPTGKHITTIETELSCRPCTKHGNSKCKHKIYKKCMKDIFPEQVAKEIR